MLVQIKNILLISERQSGPFQFAELGLFFGAVLVALVAANTATTLITAANNITATTPGKIVATNTATTLITAASSITTTATGKVIAANKATNRLPGKD